MHRGSAFALEPKASYCLSAALGGEFVFTFVLCFVVLSVAAVGKPLCQCFGLAIVACITAGGIVIGGVSGGVPSLSIGARAGSMPSRAHASQLRANMPRLER